MWVGSGWPGVDLENKKVACSKLIWLNEMGTVKIKTLTLCAQTILHTTVDVTCNPLK